MSAPPELHNPLPGQPAKTPDPDKVRTLGTVLLVCFLLVGLALLYWGVLRAPAILARDDNPRLIEAAQRVVRGAILDRDGQVLAQNTGSGADQQRLVSVPAAGHATGFNSLRFGAGGAEAAFDVVLRGAPASEGAALWRAWLHETPRGADVRLALDTELQAQAAGALAGQHGAMLLLQMPHDQPGRANTLVLASSPAYDANLLDEQFEALAVDAGAPLLNRATQGQYQPGLLLGPLIAAYAVDQGLLRLEDEVTNPNRGVRVNGSTLRCQRTPPNPVTWADALRLRCPAPLQNLAEELGAEGLQVAFATFGLTRDPAFELDVMTSEEELLADPALAAIGQDNLSVTPLQIGLALAALGGDGKLPVPQIGASLIDAEGKERPLPAPGAPSTAVSPAAAEAVYAALPRSAGYTEFSPAVLSGPAGRANAWYTGRWSGAEADYVAVVVLEDSADEEAALAAGRALLDAVAKP